jgi:polysaccharide export outer membrane protein
MITRDAKLSLICVLALSIGSAALARKTLAQSAPAEAAVVSGSGEVAHGSDNKEASNGAVPLAKSEANVYRIGAEDELQISVWHEPELSAVVLVRPDGNITLSLLGDVAVVGLKPEELQLLLASKLKPFVNEPQVTVIPRNIRSRKVYLVGQVSHQGSFPLNGSLTVLELIADAGGLNPFAKKGSIYVLRVENGQKKRIPFNYKKALSGKEQNITLLPGDVVVVP